MKLTYFVQEIGHPDIPRRLAMLREGGAETQVFGFHRGKPPEADPTVIDLGRTVDARLVHRMWAVAKAAPLLRRWAGEIASSRVILARNLDMLFLAAVARRLYAPRAALVYECLDIHRLMLSNGAASTALRQVERRLLARSQGLIVSSPGFLREYFERTHPALPRSFVVENKVFSPDKVFAGREQVAPDGPPWRIGWFGLLRCRRSRDILIHLLRAAPGLAQVVVAGRPSADVFGDVENAFQGIPGLTSIGPFRDEAALAALYGSVHFAWTGDYFAAGASSDWLLPNRLYRAALYGAVPLAIAGVETGRWLAAHSAGILLEEPAENSLVSTIRSMTSQRFAAARTAVRNIPTSALVTEPDECKALVKALGELGQ